MTRRVGVVLCVAFGLLIPAAPAGAAIKVVSHRSGPYKLNPYEVRYTSAKTRAVRAPRVEGSIVGMYARVEDRRGRKIPVKRIMLHHVLYKNLGRFAGDRTDPICGHRGQSFYGTGEENQRLRLPRGYGYPIHKRDRWQMSWMLMNHKNRVDRAYIKYRAVIDTSPRIRPVTPYWIRVTGCRWSRDPIYNVKGGGRPGSVNEHSTRFRLPRAGRLVAVNGHVHGGNKGIAITQPRCNGRPLMYSRPLYGLRSHPYYHVLPVLHEPGPIATSWSFSRRGIPVRAHEPLRLTAVYDNELPHTRVMGIVHLYVAHSRVKGPRCGALPGDLHEWIRRLRGRYKPPKVIVPLTGLSSTGRAITIHRPPGPLRLFRHPTVDVRDGSFNRRNLSIPQGARVRWRFHDPIWHDVTLANGPEGFSSPLSKRGKTYVKRFKKPGLYRVYCSLHPVDMTQAIKVRGKGHRRRRPNPSPPGSRPPSQGAPPGEPSPAPPSIPFLPPGA
jgi:hypothetical protein